jgi:hypothetical protein
VVLTSLTGVGQWTRGLVFLCVLGSEGCVLVPRSSGQWHSGYVGLANLGSESETCVGSRVHLVGVSISFEKNFYRLTFTPPSLVRRIGPLVMDETSIFFLSTQTETEEGSHRGGLTVVRPSRARRRPGVGGDGDRRSRATHSGPHLRLGRLVEGDRRRRVDCRPRRHWWRRWELGGERGKWLGGVG